MKFYEISILRKLFLPLLSKIAFNFVMKHPWNKQVKLKLNLFMHKGYWYHKKNREKKSMLLFSSIIRKGDVVAEVGGHIGFISTYFSSLVGENGKVFIFEPGKNNLPYIRENISFDFSGKLSRRMELIEAAVSDKEGTSTLYEDSLTGQNNSLVEDFEGLKRNELFSYIETDILAREVKIVSLDNFFYLSRTDVNFIKIDIEGHEWAAIKGCAQVISKTKPAMMVEIQSCRDELFNFFESEGYILFTDSFKIHNEASELNGNIFCLHKSSHSTLINDLGLI